MKITYHQLNLIDLDLEKELLTNLQNEGFFIIGIEITNPDISQFCSINIDPQHDNISNHDITSLEYVYNCKESLIDTCKIFDKIAFIILKPDIDTVASIALFELLLKDQFEINNDIVLRLKAIAKSDRHGRSNYKHKKEDYFFFEDYNIYGVPIGLITMTGDYKLDITLKVINMVNYITNGNFETIEKYSLIAVRNLKKSNKNTNLEIIIPKKLVFVKSNFRGAISYGYKSASTVIAKNPNYNFGYGINKVIGKKITIAQYEHNKFIDLIGLKNELNELEEGWGGSSVIIGSPQTHPCTLEDDLIIKLTLKYLYGK